MVTYIGDSDKSAKSISDDNTHHDCFVYSNIKCTQIIACSKTIPYEISSIRINHSIIYYSYGWKKQWKYTKEKRIHGYFHQFNNGKEHKIGASKVCRKFSGYQFNVHENFNNILTTNNNIIKEDNLEINWFLNSDIF